MTGTGALIFLPAGSARGGPARPPPIEKSCCDSRLEQGADGTKPPETTISAARALVPASRYETCLDAPMWNGPRLRAAFVAQVLGQLLQTPPDNVRRGALAAYGAPRDPVASAIDDRA